MEVNINNQQVEVEEKTVLYTLLSLNNLAEKKGIAVAVNNKVLPKADWVKYQLQINDKITIIRATQGG
jgi:sulfur carrier protein